MADTPKLIVLGSGSAIPSADRTTSCYLVVDKGTVLLIDLGPGALQRAAALGYALDSLDGVLITHSPTLLHRLRFVCASRDCGCCACVCVMIIYKKRFIWLKINCI